MTEGEFDTGGLIEQGVSGFVYGRDPEELADAIPAAQGPRPHEGDRRRRGAESAAQCMREVFFPDSPAPATP